jgi:hypothetical protein
MFRFTFEVDYTTKDGEKAKMTSQVQLDTDNIFTARGELVYGLSRNPHVFAPFTFEFVKMEEWKDGCWQ